jgi:hypothetical protein
MFSIIRSPIAPLFVRASGATLLSAALLTFGAALDAAPAVADQSYPPGLFENSPVVPNGQPSGEPAPGQPPGPDGPDADASPPPGYDATPGLGYGGPPPGYDAPPAQGYGGPVAPRGYYDAPPGAYVPGRPEAYAPPSGYCAGIATRVFGSLEELRRAHARCDRAYNAPLPPPGYPPAY